MSKKRRLPKFADIKEEAEFWNTHSLADYWDRLKPVQVRFNPSIEKKETMTLRMMPSLKKEIERIARMYDISTSSLIRMWVVDKIRNWDR